MIIFLRKLFWVLMFPRQALFGAIYGIIEWTTTWHLMKKLYWVKPIPIKKEEG